VNDGARGAVSAGASPSPATQENLAGLVERVTFHNEDSGFCVLRVKARGQRDLITVIGHTAAISAGEFIQVTGQWVNDRVHGVQFRADFLRSAPPTTAEGIEKYLASGMIKGIGPVYARKLVKAFREQVFDVIEQHPSGCRRSTASARSAPTVSSLLGSIRRAICEIMIFLHSHGVGTSPAKRIYKTYIRIIPRTGVRCWALVGLAYARCGSDVV
jgi:exodeoxyribonuclease V alpha subunit